MSRTSPRATTMSCSVSSEMARLSK
jgi:hypothetical protein